MKLPIPHRGDPCWIDPENRTRLYREFKTANGLSLQDVMRLTGCNIGTARMWGNRHKTVIGIDTLRALMYDVLVGAR